jgi:acyl-CoA synthetase (NDP forming)
MAESLGPAAWPLVIQPMAQPGVDVAVIVTGHPVVGPVLTLEPGGVATGVGAAQAHLVPLTDADAGRVVAPLAVTAGLGPTARAALEDLLLRVGALVEEVPEVTGLELNPVVVSAAGAAVLDARLRVAPVDRNPLPPVRRL